MTWKKNERASEREENCRVSCREGRRRTALVHIAHTAICRVAISYVPAGQCRRAGELHGVEPKIGVEGRSVFELLHSLLGRVALLEGQLMIEFEHERVQLRSLLQHERSRVRVELDVEHVPHSNGEVLRLVEFSTVDVQLKVFLQRHPDHGERIDRTKVTEEHRLVGFARRPRPDARVAREHDAREMFVARITDAHVTVLLAVLENQPLGGAATAHAPATRPAMVPTERDDRRTESIVTVLAACHVHVVDPHGRANAELRLVDGGLFRFAN